MLESKHQKKMIDHLSKMGYICINITKSNWNGIPDVLVLVGGSRHFWIEAKAENGVQSELQKYRQRQLEALGDLIIIPYGYDDFILQFHSQISENIK